MNEGETPVARSYAVLVPVDGSAGSLRALAVACRRARSQGGTTVIALNVQDPMPPSRFSPLAAIREHQERMSAEVFRKVERIAKREKASVKQAMVVGLPAEAIIAQAVRQRVAEIVMGTRGMGRVKGLFMGSVAMKVVQMSKVPVTLVK